MANFTLDLPFEIRRLIYKELMGGPNHIVTLYHDRNGRSHKPKNLHPNILRVSKATYAEAASVLYEETRFEIRLATRVIEPDFMRKGSEYADEFGTVEELFFEEGEELEKSTEKQKSPNLGIFTKATLQKMRLVELVVSYNAIWGPIGEDIYLSTVGEKILPKILRVLAEEGTRPEKTVTRGPDERRKILKVNSFAKELCPNLLIPSTWPPAHDHTIAEYQDEEMVKLLALFERVSRARDTSFWSGGWLSGMKCPKIPLEGRRVEKAIESAEWRIFLREGRSKRQSREHYIEEARRVVEARFPELPDFIPPHAILLLLDP